MSANLKVRHTGCPLSPGVQSIPDSVKQTDRHERRCHFFTVLIVTSANCNESSGSHCVSVPASLIVVDVRTERVFRQASVWWMSSRNQCVCRQTSMWWMSVRTERVCRQTSVWWMSVRNQRVCRQCCRCQALRNQCVCRQASVWWMSSRSQCVCRQCGECQAGISVFAGKPSVCRKASMWRVPPITESLPETSTSSRSSMESGVKSVRNK